MRNSQVSRPLVFVAAMTLAIAACSGATSSTAPQPSPVATASDSAPPSEAATPTEAPIAKEFKVSFLSAVGLPQLAMLAAFDQLRADGFTIEVTNFAEAELAVEAVFTGDYHISGGVTNLAMLATQRGGSVPIIAERTANDYVVWAVTDIAGCADLGGSRLAIHSEGAVGTAMLRAWIDSTCPGTEPEWLILPGSENRYAALLAGEIDASPLSLAEAIQLEAEGEGRFHSVANFVDDLPELVANAVIGNGTWMADNPGTTEAIVLSIVEQHRKVADEPGYLRSLIDKYVPDAEFSDEIVQAYIDLEMFEVNGGLTPERAAYTVDFFTDAGVLEPGLDPEVAFDLSYLDNVLAEIGRR